MRELSYEDVQQVSGGSNISDGLALIGAGITIAAAVGIIGVPVLGAFGISTLASLASLSLTGAGGYTLGGALPRVTVGPDFSVSVARESDC